MMLLKLFVLVICAFVSVIVCENSTESTEYSESASQATVPNDLEAILSSAEPNTNSTVINFDKADREIEEDEDGEESENVCNYGISSFVRNFNASTYLPDDYFEVSESMWNHNLYEPVKDLNSTIEPFNRLLQYVDKLRSNKDAKDALQYLSSVMTDQLYNAQVSPLCLADIVRVMSGIQNFELWAMRMPDAWANTVPSGLLSGHISSFGEFDQCIKIKSPPISQGENEPDRHVYGRYCQAQMRIKVPDMDAYKPEWEDWLKQHPLYGNVVNFYNNTGLVQIEADIAKVLMESVPVLKSNIAHYGFCMPNTCSSEDLQRIFNAIFYPITKIPTVVDPDLCTDHKDVQNTKLDSFQWFSIYILSTLTTLVTLSSIYHLYLMYFVDNSQQLLPSYNEKENNNQNQMDRKGDNLKINLCPTLPAKIDRSIGQQLVLAFSFFENTNKLLKTDNRLAIIDTLRFLLTVGVYAVQAFNFSMMITLQILRNQIDTLPGQLIQQNRYFMARVPGMYIDGFVFTLGLTLYMSQSSRLRKSNGQFSYFSYMFKRWFRLSMAMLGTFVFLYLFTLIGDGPLWFINERWVLAPCKKWSAIISSFLYYSNWNPAINDYRSSASFPICNPPTWFLSASTQIYAVLPLIFVPLYRWPKLGMAILLSLFVLSPLLTTSPTWFLGHSTYYDLTDLQSAGHSLRKFLNYHTNPLQYSTSASIGILTGWLLKNKPNMKFLGGRKMEIFLWMLSFTTIVACFSSNNYLWTLEEKRPQWLTLSWVVIVKFLWPLSLAYIIFMCSSGRARTMNMRLSMNSLQPLAKLSYSIYLLRVPVIFYRYTTARYTYGLYYWQVWQNIAIDYLITAFFAFILYILFEAPSIEMIRIFEGDKIWSCLESEPQQKKETIIPNGNGIPPVIVQEKQLPNDKECPQFYVYNGSESQRL